MFGQKKQFGRSRSVNYALPKENKNRSFGNYKKRDENYDPFAGNDSLYNPLLATKVTAMRAERKLEDLGYVKKARKINGSGRDFFRGNNRSTSRNSFNGNNKRNFGNRNNRATKGIDINRFVKKAELIEEEAYIPKNTFQTFTVNETLHNNLKDLGFVNPTPIQDESIPAGLEGKDVLGIANTGTGKTAAFLIPMINKMVTEKKKGLVLAPTRELAIQIEKDFRNFTHGMRLWTLLITGGANMGRQIRGARMHYDIIIGTPGRVTDLMQKGLLNLENVDMVVLDEADRMLDMGFREDITKILNQTRNDRQTFFFSATMSSDIDVLIHKYLNNPIRISVKTQETSHNVDQDIVKIYRGDNKIEKLHDILIKPDFTKTIIFCKTKKGTEELADELLNRGFKATPIHGDMSQYERNVSIRKFKENLSDILIATDVAARGLDIKEVSHVINFNTPENYDDYVHRIGRTGRAGKKGFALTFVEV
jgi:superfamily II DNA/RNA helicase